MVKISAILPTGAVAAEWIGDAEPPPLWAEEAGLANGCVEKRRRELAAGRACGRRALAALGVPPAPILRGSQREPLWPAGVVGSLTHCAGYCAAAVASDLDVASIGIDAEPNAPLPEGVVAKVALPQERVRLRALDEDGTCWDRLLFSAKESIYKAWYPLAHGWLGFHDALVEFHPGDGSFSARLSRPGPLESLEGRYLVADGLVLTAVGTSAIANTRRSGAPGFDDR